MVNSDQALVDGAGGASRVGRDRSVDAGGGLRCALLRDRLGLAGQGGWRLVHRTDGERARRSSTPATTG